jgi:hypothetical protein
MTAWDSLHSLLDYECLLFYCDWLGSDLGIGYFFYKCGRRITHDFSFTNELPAASSTNPFVLIRMASYTV